MSVYNQYEYLLSKVYIYCSLLYIFPHPPLYLKYTLQTLQYIYKSLWCSCAMAHIRAHVLCVLLQQHDYCQQVKLEICTNSVSLVSLVP